MSRGRIRAGRDLQNNPATHQRTATRVNYGATDAQVSCRPDFDRKAAVARLDHCEIDVERRKCHAVCIRTCSLGGGYPNLIDDNNREARREQCQDGLVAAGERVRPQYEDRWERLHAGARALREMRTLNKDELGQVLSGRDGEQDDRTHVGNHDEHRQVEHLPTERAVVAHARVERADPQRDGIHGEEVVAAEQVRQLAERELAPEDLCGRAVSAIPRARDGWCSRIYAPGSSCARTSARTTGVGGRTDHRSQSYTAKASGQR